MSEHDAAVAAYVAALIDPTPANVDALAPFFSSSVEVVGIAGPGQGIDAVRQAIENPRRPGLLTSATWSMREEADGVVVDLALAPGGLVASVTLYVAFDGDVIARVDQTIEMAPPAPPIALELTEELRTAVTAALANSTPMLLVYVDKDGAPHVSLRGSVSVHGATQLALWIRDPAGGFLAAIPSNPHVALQYRDPAAGVSYQFSGVARTDDTPEVRDAVFDRTPIQERNLDARRRGRAVIVELSRIEGSAPSGRFVMAANSD